MNYNNIDSHLNLFASLESHQNIRLAIIHTFEDSHNVITKIQKNVLQILNTRALSKKQITEHVNEGKIAFVVDNKIILHENMKNKINLHATKVLNENNTESDLVLHEKNIYYASDAQMLNFVQLIFSKLAKHELKASKEKRLNFKKQIGEKIQTKTTSLNKKIDKLIKNKVMLSSNALHDEVYNEKLKIREEKNINKEYLDSELKEYYKEKFSNQERNIPMT